MTLANLPTDSTSESGRFRMGFNIDRLVQGGDLEETVLALFRLQ
jgi:hypothetical protein